MTQFTVLRHMAQAKNKFKILSFKKANSQLFKELVSKTPRKQLLGTRDRNRAGRPLSMVSVDHKTFPSPGVRKQARKKPAKKQEENAQAVPVGMGVLGRV